MVNRSKVALRVLPYVAGLIFLSMWIAAMDISSELSMMSDAGFNFYHDQIDVQVFWLQSKACMVLPPDGYVTNCTYTASISVIPVLTILLVFVLALYGLVKRRGGGTNLGRPQNPR